MNNLIEQSKVEVLDNGPVLPVVFHQNPFSNQVQYAVALEGQSIQHVITKAKLPVEYANYLRVWIDDREIAREDWATTYIVTGQQLYVRVVPQKSGKDVFRFIAMLVVVVAVAYIAPQLAPQLLSAIGVTGTAVTASALAAATAFTIVALSTIGFLALNALIPPPKFGGNANQDDPRFDLTASSNQFQPYGNVARVFGKRRLFPMMAARPYSEIQGDDEYLRMALVVGWGPLKIENIKIGETPISAFSGVEVEIREGWSTDAPLTLFTRTATEEAISVLLEPFAYVGGYYDGGIGYAGDNYRYDGEADTYGPRTFTTSNDWVQRTTKTNCVEFSVDFGFPSGLFSFDAKGNKASATVNLEVQYRLVGATTWISAAWANSEDTGFGTTGSITITAADSSAVRRSGRVKVPSAGQYEVRVRRTTSNQGAKFVDAVYWGTLRTLKPDYPVLQNNVALIAIRMKASNQLNGVPQTISCEATSYLPVYNGSTWSYQLSSNPAWAYTDLMRRRAGDVFLTDDRLDLTTLKAWADACDVTAPNAAEPRWSFNDVIEGGSIYDNLRRVAANARAFPVVRDGKHSVVRDIPQTVPVQHITPRNSWGYSGVKAFIDFPHALRVTFLNKDMGFQADERIVYYDGYNSANATKFETLELTGCTSATQAYREARYHMAVARLRPEEHSVQMDIEALRCTVGDLVRFSHDAIAIGIAATRTAAYALNGENKVVTLTLADDLYFEAGKSYALRARRADGATVLLSINNPGEGYANTVTLTVPAVTTAAPDIGDLVVFGEATKETAPMIIKKIDAAEDLTCTLYMIDAADAVHTADTGTIPAFNSYLSLPSAPGVNKLYPVYISTVRSDDSAVIVNPDGSLTYRILVQLQQPEGSTERVSHFEVQHRIANTSAFQTLRVERDSGFGYVLGVEVGANYELRSRGIGEDGQPTVWSSSVNHVVVGKAAAPNNPTSFTATAIPGGIDLNWVNPLNDDFWQVEIYENTVNNSSTATKISETSSTSYSRLGLSSSNGVRYYWLKALSTSGVTTAFVGPVSTTALNRVLLGTLSNEAVNLPADAAGAVSSFATAEGQLSLFDGPTDVLASATLTAVVSNCTGTINTAVDTPVAGKPKGYYRITAMSAETGTLTITATYNGQSVNRVFSVTKARTGTPGSSASVLTLSTSSQTFTFDGSGAASPASQSITMTANLQNIAGSATFEATGYNAAGTSLGVITLTGTGNSRTLSLANFGSSAYVVVTATASGFTDTTTLVRLSAGAPGSPGAQPITGFLTNEATTLAAAVNGTVTDFAPAGGTFKVFEGVTDRTGATVTYTVQSSTSVTVSINASGVYTVTAMAADTASATLRAVFGGVTIDKVLSLSKSRQGANGDPGAPASVLTLASTSQTMTFDGSGTASPSSQTITFTPNLQNASGTVAYTATAYNSAGTNIGAVTLGASGNNRTMTNAQFTAIAATAYVVVTATLAPLSDTTTVVRLQAGAPAAQPITGFLTNEASTLAAATDGTVSDFAPAGGTFKVFEGITDRTGALVTYTIPSSSNVTISISAAGAYTVTAMAADTATATLRAVYGGVTIDKVLNLSKSRQGTPGNNASVLTLTSTAQAITFDAAGSASPSTQTITFTANLQNLTGTAVFTATAFSAANANLGTVTLGGTTNTRTLTNALFVTFPTTAYITVSAALSGFTDTMTIVRLQAGAKGDPGTDAIVGFLTNEAVTLAASSTGVVSSFTPASGTFKVFQGLTDRTTSATFTVSSNTDCTVAINGTTGAYTVSAMAQDTASAVLQAVYSGATIQKTLSLSKSRAGGAGAPGDPGTAAISGYVTNEAIQLFAYAEGTVTSYTGASGSFRVFSGNTDISSSFTLATGVSGNPQNLTVTYTNQSYSITGGFDTTEDTASLTIRATGTGTYAGVTLDKVVSLSKAKGGYEIVAALPTTNNFAGRVVFLSTDSKLYRYVGAPTNAFTAAVPAADVTGVLTNSEISATKVTGSVGGGNLLANSSFRNFAGTIDTDGSFPTFWGVYNNGGVSNTTRVIAGGPFGVNYVRITANASTTQTFGIYGNVSLGQYPNIWQPGQMYMLSFYARAGNASVAGKFMNALNSNMGFVSGVPISNPALLETVWQRYIWLASPASNATTPTSEFYISLVEGTAGPPAVITIPSGGIIEIAAPQVEQGQIASGYSTRADEILPNRITSTEIKDSAVTSNKIVDSAVTAVKIGASAVETAKIADAAISSLKIADSAVTAVKIGAGAVETAKIADSAIAAAKIADGAVGSTKIADSAVGSGKLADNAVTAAKINAAAIETAKIADSAITTIKINAGAVETAKIADAAVATAKIADSAIATAKIADAAIATAKIADNAITTGKINAGAVSAAKFASGIEPVGIVTGSTLPTSQTTSAIYLTGTGKLYRWIGGAYSAVVETGDLSGTISTAQIANDAVTEVKIANASVTGAKIGDAAVAEAKLANDAVTGVKIKADAVTAGKIATDAVTADKIAANAVTAGKIAANSITASKLAIVAAGMALNRDPQMTTDAYLSGIGGATLLSTDAKFSNTTQTDGPVGTSVLKYTGGSNADWSSELIPLDLTKTYRISLWARQEGTSKHYITAVFCDAAGASISGGGTGFSTPTYHYWGRMNQPFPSTWTLYSVVFGPGLAYSAPSGAKFIRLGMLQNYGSTTTDTVYMSDYRIEEVLPATLIQDGVITTEKLNALSVTTAKLAAGAVTAAKITANTITATQIAANTITSAEIAADTITAGNIAAGAITASEIASGAITTTKLSIGDFSVLNANSTFEEGDIAWDKGSGWSIVNDPANSRIGLWIGRSTFAGSSAFRGTIIPTKPGEAFYCEGWIKHVGATGTGSYVRISGMNSASAEIWTANGNTIPSSTTAYTLSYGTFVVPANVVQVRVEVVGSISGGTVHVDDVRMMRAANSVLISDGAVSAAKIAANTITADQIASATITTTQIASDTIVAGNIAANAITASEIATDAVTAAKIEAGAITAAKISSKVITADKIVLTNSNNIITNPVMANNSAVGYSTGTPVVAASAPSGCPALNAMRQESLDLYSEWFDVLPGETYNIRVTAAASAGVTSANFGVGFRIWSSDGNQNVWTDATGTAPGAFPFSGAWTSVGGVYTVQANAIKLQAWLHAEGYRTGTNPQPWFWTNLRITRAASSELIVDGAILATKIATDAVTANKIEANAVTAVKINAGAVEADKIATNAVTADKINANAVTADKINANAVTAGKIAAGSIATNSLIVTGRGAAINDDPLCQDPTAWQDGAHGTTAEQKTITDAPSGNTVYRSIPSPSGFNTGSSGIQTSKLYPVSSQKRYRFTAFLRSVSGTGVAYLRIVDQNGNQVYLSGFEGFTPASTWTRYSAIYQPDASVKSVRLRAILNWTGNTGYHEVTDFRLEEMAEADLIVDGSIIASKIATDAITATKISAGSIVSSKLAIGDTSNMYPDPDFVDLAAYSTANGTLSLVPTADPVASKNYLYTGPIYNEFTTIPSGVPVEPLKYYYFSCSAFTETGGDAWCYISWQSMAANGAQTEISVTTVVNGTVGSLTKGEVVAQAPSGARRAVMVFRNLGTGGKIARFGGPIIRRAMQGELVVDGTITASKIAVGAIDADRIASNAITAVKINAGAVEADKIASNAVTAAKIAANSITTNKLLVTGGGNAINDDPMFQDPSAWELSANATFGSGTGSDGAVASTYISSNVNQNEITYSAKRYPVGPGKRYRLSAMLFAATGNDRNMYIAVEFYSDTGGYIGSAATGWGGTLSGYVYGGQPPTNVWTRQGGQFGAGTGRPIPANARSAKIAIWFNYSSGSGLVLQACQDLRLEELVEAEVIVDGAIIADKIAANAVTAVKINADAVTADKIASNAVTAVKINAGAIEADKIASNAVTAVKINADAVTADKIASNAVTAVKINAGAVEADKIAANAITAAKINADAVTADKIASNAVTAVKINTGAIEADKIATNAITADKINTGAVTAAKISVSSLSAISATVGTLQTATTGARVQIKDNIIRVFDASSTGDTTGIRVKIGDLS